MEKKQINTKETYEVYVKPQIPEARGKGKGK